MKSLYIATVPKDFELNKAFKKRLKESEIDLVHFHKNLGILKLASAHDLLSRKLEGISSIERDGEFKAIDKQENVENCDDEEELGGFGIS